MVDDMKKRIRKEKNRLLKFYKDLDPTKKGIAAALIERAAFMRVQLEDLETDLNENGWTEKFQQGNAPAYDRARPAGQTYNSLNGNYQKIIKQLDAMLPELPAAAPEDDGFEAFVLERPEV